MKRRWNAPIWLGFLFVLSAPVVYFSVFIRFPALRDHPWLTFPVFGIGLMLMAFGVRCAYHEPWIYRGKIFGTILAVLSIAVVTLFGAGVYYFARQLPTSGGAPKVGEQAPDFTLQDTDNHNVTLSSLLHSTPAGGDKLAGVVLIFYRGAW